MMRGEGMRNERWATRAEITTWLKSGGAGPVFYWENGKLYVHDGEGHILILGESGTGKSRRCTIPLIMVLILMLESAVVVDPKGEIWAATKDMITKSHDCHVIDFRNLYDENAEGWNPLTAPYELWKEASSKSRHRAEQLIEDLACAMFPEGQTKDPFWENEARSLFIGLVYILFTYGKKEEVNLASVYYLISMGDERYGGNSTYLKEAVSLCKENENVTMQLYSYVSTANDTRAGIRSTCLDGLAPYVRSVSVRDFICRDDLSINELRGDKPTLIYIILPDETPIYNNIAASLVGQIMNHYIRMAEQDYNGRLPIRMNCLLEELGSIGGAIPKLDHAMTASRSRNIRMGIVLQSLSQLNSLYGESKAATIQSNCDARIAFRLHNYETLNELSRMCGEREVIRNGTVSKEVLITPSQLAAMETGQALVSISGRLKFISWLPDYTEMNFPKGTGGGVRKFIRKLSKKTSFFDIHEFVDMKKRANMREKERMNESSWLMELPTGIDFEEDEISIEEKKHPTGKEGGGQYKPSKLVPEFDIDDLRERIDRKIAELEAIEKNEKEKNDAEKKVCDSKARCDVVIVSWSSPRKTEVLIKKACGLTDKQVKYIMAQGENGICTVKRVLRFRAEKLVEDLKKIGTFAYIS